MRSLSRSLAAAGAFALAALLPSLAAAAACDPAAVIAAQHRCADGVAAQMWSRVTIDCAREAEAAAPCADAAGGLDAYDYRMKRASSLAFAAAAHHHRGEDRAARVLAITAARAFERVGNDRNAPLLIRDDARTYVSIVRTHLNEWP